mgnify:CR=1 FL=1
MTGQLPLALELREGHALENFHAGPNRAAWATVSAAGDGDEGVVAARAAAEACGLPARTVDFLAELC